MLLLVDKDLSIIKVQFRDEAQEGRRESGTRRGLEERKEDGRAKCLCKKDFGFLGVHRIGNPHFRQASTRIINMSRDITPVNTLGQDWLKIVFNFPLVSVVQLIGGSFPIQ